MSIIAIAKDLVYDKEKDSYLGNYKIYSRTPSWISYIIKRSINCGVFIPRFILNYNRMSMHIPRSGIPRLGLYSKGSTGEGFIMLFTYKHKVETKSFILAHEIGHHDHYNKMPSLIIPEEQEEYANKIATLITGLRPPTFMMKPKEYTERGIY